jgi:hypothetical protein
MDEERRAHPRYGCSGEAGMRFTPTWPVVRGQILNLSLVGCMIEFPARMRMERGQTVELIFNVRNLPFHVRAVIQGERGKAQYGFEFLALSARTRTGLEELIDELKAGGFDPELCRAGKLHTK